MATKLLYLLLILSSTTFSLGSYKAKATSSNCNAGMTGECYNKAKSMQLKLIAIPTILIASMIGVCLPLFSCSIPAVHPYRNFFVLFKDYAFGVILATGYMHVLPDSFDDLASPCLPENPWANSLLQPLLQCFRLWRH
ncbi:putative zinc/iron permease [Dioscorea sansibarensis]